MKLRWKVDPEPTGPYSSFQHRSWPQAFYPDGRYAGTLQCSEPYVPQAVRDNSHAPLFLLVNHYNHPQAGNGWRVLRSKASYPTLKDAKEAFARMLDAHPEYQPRSTLNVPR